MRVVVVLYFAAVWCHTGAGQTTWNDFPVCMENCTPVSAVSCCVGGLPFGRVELEARDGIAAGNEALRRAEEVLLESSRAAVLQNRRPVIPSGVAEEIHLLAKRVLHWLSTVKLRLARFYTHDVVGASARGLYSLVGSHMLLMMNLLVWSTDEIAGLRNPPPTVNGYGPCGGRWPCQRTFACEGQSCLQSQMPPRVGNVGPQGRTPYQIVSKPPLYYYYKPQNQYIPYRPNGPSLQNPKLSNAPVFPVEISVKNKNATSPNENHKDSNHRAQLPENYYSYGKLIHNLNAAAGAVRIPKFNPDAFWVRHNPSAFVPSIFEPPPAKVEQHSFEERRLSELQQSKGPLIGISRAYQVVRNEATPKLPERNA